MAKFSNNNGPRVSIDRFGNPFQLKRTKVKEGKNGGEYDSAIFELCGKDFKIEVSECQKESDRENAGKYWIKVTKLEPRKKASM